MTEDELLFFSPMPGALPLYEALSGKLLGQFPDLAVKFQKSQITFQARYGFAFVSLRRMKGCPAVFLILSFGLSHRLDSPRIAVAVQPYPNRWTHHLLLTDPAEIDRQMLDWLQEAYWFAENKR